MERKWITDAPPSEAEYPSGTQVWVTMTRLGEVAPASVRLADSQYVREEWGSSWEPMVPIAWMPRESPPAPYQPDPA